jgi:hypothetical protein
MLSYVPTTSERSLTGWGGKQHGKVTEASGRGAPPPTIITRRPTIMISASNKEAKEHAEAAHEHSGIGHKHTTTAHEHSHK